MSEERRKDYQQLTPIVSEMKEKIDKIYTVIYENGLLSQVKTNTDYISSQKKFAGVVLTTFIVGIVGVIIGFLVFKLGIPH